MKNTRLLVVMLVLALLVFGGLLASALQRSVVYYYTLEEIHEVDTPNRTLRLKGELIRDSVEYDPSGPLLTFLMTDGTYHLRAVAHQPVPDNMLHSEEIIVEGRLCDDGVLQVTKIMLQCPSRYEPEEGV